MSPGLKVGIVLIAIIVVMVAFGVTARHLGYNKVIGETIVRCRAGHVFRTLWVPGASLKAVRLGPYRLQRCPVGNHVTLVTPANVFTLTDDERQMAEQYHDGFIS